MTNLAQPTNRSAKLTALIAQSAAPDLAETSLPPAPKSQTPQLLRRYQLLAVIALLVLGLSTIAATVQLRSDLTQGPGIVDQYARLGSVHSDLLSAGNAAARNLLSPSAADRKEVSSHLSDADRLILQATAERPQDSDQLAALSTSLIEYDRLLYTATTGNSASARAALQQADQVLDEQLAPTIGALRDRLATEAAAGSWPGWGWLLAVTTLAALAVLVTISVGTARITRRYLNRGLLVALSAAILLTVLGSTAISRADKALNLDQSAEVNTTVSISAARAGLAAADRLQLRGALAQQWSSGASATVTTTSDPAQSTAQDYPTMSNSIVAVRRAQSTINSSLERHDWTQASGRLTAAKGVQSALTTFEKAAQLETQSAAAEAVQTLGATAFMMVVLAIIETLLLLIGLVMAIWGLDRVLREYR